MPNLNTDRGAIVTRRGSSLNVRRLMYQPLIWLGRIMGSVLRDDPRRLAAPFYSEDVKRLADSLIDGVRRNVEPRRDLFR